MSDFSQYSAFPEHRQPAPEEKRKPKKSSPWINAALFIFTFITTTASGAFWLEKNPYELENFKFGLTYSVLILLFLSFHEFGHYFAAKYHKVKVTLPFYIPFPLVEYSFGTMGAVIRIKDHIKSRRALFDIGIAGPIAGYVISVGTLVYGLMTLPPVEYLYSIHPKLAVTGIPNELSGLTFSSTLLYEILKNIVPIPPNGYIPPMNEIYHYPFLCAGWFGLFVTSLNLMPVGQLDGGHIIYALFGTKSKIIARVFFGFIAVLSVIGALNQLGITDYSNYGSIMWVVWIALIIFIIKIDHPPFYDPEPIGAGRKILGVFAFVMFISSFTPVPIKDL